MELKQHVKAVALAAALASSAAVACGAGLKEPIRLGLCFDLQQVVLVRISPQERRRAAQGPGDVHQRQRRHRRPSG